MPPRKPPAKKTPNPSPAAQADLQAVSECLSALMEWCLTKLNGDPAEEGFDLLLVTDGPDGRKMGKYCLGDFPAAKERLKADLEADVAATDRYLYAYRGYWEAPGQGKSEGALVVIESRQLIPQVFGFVIAPGADGKLAVQGQLQRLAVADWSLFHRQPR